VRFDGDGDRGSRQSMRRVQAAQKRGPNQRLAMFTKAAGFALLRDLHPRASATTVR